MNIHVQKIAQLKGHNASIYALTEGGQSAQKTAQIFTAGGDGWVVRWDLDNPELGKLAAQSERQIFCLDYQPNANKIIAGDMDGGVRWLDLAMPSESRHFLHHKKGTFEAKIIENFAYTLGGDGVLTRWQLAPFRSLESVQLSYKNLRALAFAPQKKLFAVGASDGNIYFLDMNLTLQHTLTHAHANSVFTLAFSPDEQFLVSGGRDALLQVWQMADFSLISSQAAHLSTINHIAFSPKDKIFATASRDKTIKIWSAEIENNFGLLKVINTVRNGCHIRSVNKLLWVENPHYLISVSDDRSAMIWKIETIF
jgi:WD40 repeat protein